MDSPVDAVTHDIRLLLQEAGTGRPS